MLYRNLTAFLLAGMLLVPALAGCGGGSSKGSAPTANIDAGSSGDAKSGGDSSSAGYRLPSDAEDQEFPYDASSSTSATRTRPKPKPNLYPVVAVETNLGEITVRLNAEKAPITVDNFLRNYVGRDFYANTIFHHVEKDSMIIGGGYTADLTPVQPRAEIVNEAYNGLKNTRCTIAMARHPDAANSATCQFFINLADNPSLDHVDRLTDANYGYCVFGEVIDGMEVVDQIAESAVQTSGDFPKLPVDPVVIHAIRQIR